MYNIVVYVNKKTTKFESKIQLNSTGKFSKHAI